MTAATESEAVGGVGVGPLGSFRAWFGALPTFVRGLLSFVAFLLVVNIGLQFLGAIDERRGLKNAPRAFDRTDDDGFAAFVALVEGSDRDVEIRRQSFGANDLEVDSTIVILAPERLSSAGRDEITRVLNGGGRLVFAGDLGAFRPVADIAAESPLDPLDLRSDDNVGFSGYRARPIVPLAETAGTAEVSFGRGPNWQNRGPLLPLLATGDDRLPVLAGRYPGGDGYVVALANPTFLDNEHLATADNAAFALSLLGAPDRPVLLVDVKNNAVGGQGLAALPRSWTWTLYLTAAAGLLLVWSRAVRFGPPDRPRRELAPARVDYVDHLARTLATKDDLIATTEPLRQRALGRLGVGRGARGGIDPETHERLRRNGVTEEHLALLHDGPRTSADALEIGRIAADLEQRRGSRGSPT